MDIVASSSPEGILINLPLKVKLVLNVDSVSLKIKSRLFGAEDDLVSWDRLLRYQGKNKGLVRIQ